MKLFIVLLLAGFMLQAATYRKIRFSHPDFDDADARFYQDDSLIDSSVTAYPIIDSILLNEGLPTIANYDLVTPGNDTIWAYGNVIYPVLYSPETDSGYLRRKEDDSLEYDSIRYQWWSGADTFATMYDTVFAVPHDDSLPWNWGYPADIAITQYLTSGDTNTFMWWLGAGRGSLLLASTIAKTCNISVVVKDSDGNPLPNIWVSAYYVRSNITDSLGASVSTATKYQPTNGSGVATFQLYWSSYLIPATNVRFQAHSPRIGGLKKEVTIPRESSYLINLND